MIASNATYLLDNLGEAKSGVATYLMRVSSRQHDHLAEIGQQSEGPPCAYAKG